MPEQAITPITGAIPSIPDYELLRPIGRGAYGEVWLARNVTGSFVALKIVQRAAFDHDRPFDREFEGINRFEPISRSNPSQVAILHVGRGDGFFYYVMELADGAGSPKPEIRNPNEARSPNSETAALDASVWASGFGLPSEFDLRASDLYTPLTLKRLLNDRGALPAEECLAIALSLTRALAHLHGHGLVHRDVKPSNVIFVGGVAKLADIGLVTSVDATRSFVGTEGYLPPEGAGTPQADLYSLGKVLYEMSTGCDRKEFPALPPDIATRPDRDALAELNAIVVRACQLDSRERYQTAEEMRADLALLQGGQSVKRHRTRQQRWGIGKKAAFALGVLAIVAANVAILLRQFNRSDFSADGPASTNMVANTLCTKGLLTLRGDNYAQFAEAYTNFHRSIELDPHFARPYVGLFELRLREVVPSLGATSPEEMRTIARKLKELGPNLAATHCAQSVISYYEWDFPQARRSIQEAIRAAPQYELSHNWHGFMLTHWGWPVEGRAEREIARTLAPSKVTLFRALGHTYYIERDYTNAIALYREALALEPNHAPAYQFIAQAQRAMGDYTNAINNIETAEILSRGDASETRQRYDEIRRAFIEGGVRGYWQERWKRTEKNPNKDFYGKGVVQIHLGDTDAALGWLNKSYETREHSRESFETPLTYLLFDECWDGLRDDPRFKELLDKIGFTKVMPPRKK
ncbi:MAG: tetratricopeptide repeat protein [Verrucomicrobiota bacterium]